ncbi:M20 metallopeptidase family protein [Geosporobacter ferrireducens]|uniref:Peptidase M20 n=1 Tax=Geosporobacter ferrireducens TaxID=1424294 RepID=A0A1D8GG51_9FIRM|nr:M20 family metallopeptidase [Geosporobacter ferrireducens]AOT69875.1 peptidase M20 [Geosporobacter ferrireducens]MTI54430.1 amidohydrolase [Geosporobacter ferrireducens]
MKITEALMNKYKDRLTAIRRDLHMYPELSFKEFRTTEKIKALLEELDIDVLDMGIETGVVGLLKGAENGPTIALRGDIDALPIQEENEVPYKSKIAGVMHACGHDTHTTSLLGAAMILAELRHQLKGNVKFIFQPAEEINKGAKLLVEKGVMENPTVDAIFGLHNHPDIPVGKVGLKLGGLMAAVDTIRIEVDGVGGHGAIPNKTIDPILAGSAIVMGLQSIVSRNVNPLEAAVVSIGTMNAGIANNVIPEKVIMTGTVRSFKKEIQEKLPELLRRSIENTAAAYGASARLDYLFDLPAVFNEREMYDIGKTVVSDICGENGMVDPTPSMGGEDFSIYTELAPGCFYWLGVGNPEKGCMYQWHNPRFDADEDALIIGSAVLAQSAINAMEHFIDIKQK